jgi:hypothetical protein
MSAPSSKASTSGLQNRFHKCSQGLAIRYPQTEQPRGTKGEAARKGYQPASQYAALALSSDLNKAQQLSVLEPIENAYCKSHDGWVQRHIVAQECSQPRR